MAKGTRGTLGATVVAIALAGSGGTAWAGNGHGNGNGNGKNDPAAVSSPPAAAPDAAPGNSGSAPGHEQKTGGEAAPQPSPPPAAPPPPASKPKPAHSGHGKGGASSPGSTSGVKPSNSTAKATDAPAGFNRTKSYGNGSTAGQIAIQRGYPASGNLHGPGNSQPHKVVPCGRRHGVDVHALKSHAGKRGCDPDPPPTPTPNPNPTPNPTPTPDGPPVTPDVPSTPSSPPTAPSSGPRAHDPGDDGQRDPGAHGTSSAAAGALAAVGRATGAELPFTGLRLWTVVMIACVLLVSGAALRSRARVPAR